MEKFKISQIEIMNYWKRKQEGQYMKKLIEVCANPLGIPVYLSYDDGALVFFRNNKKALLRKYLDEKYEVKSEHVLLEDRGGKK